MNLFDQFVTKLGPSWQTLGGIGGLAETPAEPGLGSPPAVAENSVSANSASSELPGDREYERLSAIPPNPPGGTYRPDNVIPIELACFVSMGLELLPEDLALLNSILPKATKLRIPDQVCH